MAPDHPVQNNEENSGVALGKHRYKVQRNGSATLLLVVMTGCKARPDPE